MSRELVQQVSPEALAGWVIAAIAALFGSGGIGAVIQGRRARAEGVSANANQARTDEARRQAESDARTDRELTRLAGSLTAALEQIEELREEQRQAFIREQQQRTVLMYHGAWDFTVLRELRRLGVDISEPPPLTPPFDREDNDHA
jgi:uncharacterized protein HemX